MYFKEILILSVMSLMLADAAHSKRYDFRDNDDEVNDERDGESDLDQLINDLEKSVVDKKRPRKDHHKTLRQSKRQLVLVPKPTLPLPTAPPEFKPNCRRWSLC
jgi:hypothetical protein